MKKPSSRMRPNRRDSDPDADAFLHDHRRSADDLAEALGEQFLASATSGEEQGEEAMNAEVPEDSGGPFVVSLAEQEFAAGTDASNPEGATREAIPAVMRGA
jgi:hypothetical protein